MRPSAEQLEEVKKTIDEFNSELTHAPSYNSALLNSERALLTTFLLWLEHRRAAQRTAAPEPSRNTPTL